MTHQVSASACNEDQKANVSTLNCIKRPQHKTGIPQFKHKTIYQLFTKIMYVKICRVFLFVRVRWKCVPSHNITWYCEYVSGWVREQWTKWDTMEKMKRKKNLVVTDIFGWHIYCFAPSSVLKLGLDQYSIKYYGIDENEKRFFFFSTEWSMIDTLRHMRKSIATITTTKLFRKELNYIETINR